MWLNNFYTAEYAKRQTTAMYANPAYNSTQEPYTIDVRKFNFKTADGVARSYLKNMNSCNGLGCFANAVTSQTSLPSVVTSYPSYYCHLVVGSGTTPVTGADYALESQITTVSSLSVDQSFNMEKGEMIVTKTMKNTSSEEITINEVGIIAMTTHFTSYTTSTSSSSGITNGPYLAFREVLATPIVVPAGETFTISLTHKLPMMA